MTDVITQHLFWCLAAVGFLYVIVKVLSWTRSCVSLFVQACYERAAQVTVSRLIKKLPFLSSLSSSRMNTRFNVRLWPAESAAYNQPQQMNCFNFSTFVEPRVGDVIKINTERNCYAERVWQGEHVISKIRERSWLLLSLNSDVVHVDIAVETTPFVDTTQEKQ